MALPFQQTYVPTDFGSVGQLANLYTRDIAARDQQFDRGVAMESQLLSELYGTETLDPELIQGRVDKIGSQIENLVEKRGGDYGAAAKDIAKIGAKSLRDPIWALNQRKVEQSKQLEQMLARNPSLMPLKDPRSIDLNEVSSPEDIQYQVLDPQTYQNVLDTNYKSLGTRRTPLGLTNVGGYDMFETQIGLSPEQISERAQNKEEFLSTVNTLGLGEEVRNNPQIMQSLYNQYAGYLGGLDKGVVQSKGMDPLRKMQLVEAQNALTQRPTPRMDTGIPIAGQAIEMDPSFKNSRKLETALNAKDTGEFKRERALATLDRATGSESVQGKLTNKDIQGLEEQGNLLDYINEEIKKITSSTTTMPEDPTKGRFAGTNIDWNASREDRKELRRLNDLKASLKDAIDFDLETQSFDFYGNMKAINPFSDEKKDIEDFVENIPLSSFKVLTGEIAKKDSRKDQEGMEEYKNLKKGFDLIGYGYDLNEGTVYQIKDSEGNDYIVKAEDPNLNQSLISFLSPNELGELQRFHDVDFEGNTMKIGDQTQELPFRVKSQVEEGPDGRERRYYEIPEISYKDFYDTIMNQEYQSLVEAGYSEEQAQSLLVRKYRELFQDENVDLNKPYKTAAKANIVKAIELL